MDQEKIGKFILKLRKDKKMTQQELADKLNVTDRAVSHWENGRSIPDVSLFKSICEVFDISVNELITGEKLSKEKLIKQSDENIINTLKDSDKHKRKSKSIITILIIGIIILLIAILIGIKNKYPKIDLFNFTIQQADPEKPYKLEKQLEVDKKNVYYYGLDFAIFCEKNEKCYQVKDALKHSQISLDEFQKYLEKQAEYENYKIMRFWDGGTTLYSKGGMQIMFCNTIEGNKDVYIGNDQMIENLHGKYCGHKRNEDESYIRTYMVLSNTIYSKDKEYNEVLLEDINGKTGKAIVGKSFNLVPGHTYYFSFLTFDKFEDTIENIFNNSTLLEAKELDEQYDKRDWINEDIIVNEDVDNGAELNELEHVRMDIVDGTLTKASAKVRITDYTNNKYIYGSDFRIDKKVGNKWQELEIKNRLVFNAMAYHPDTNGHLEFDINWSYAYGNLTSGRYRIVKYALIRTEGCDPTCKHHYFSVEFDID